VLLAASPKTKRLQPAIARPERGALCRGHRAATVVQSERGRDEELCDADAGWGSWCRLLVAAEATMLWEESNESDHASTGSLWLDSPSSWPCSVASWRGHRLGLLLGIKR
jgi:hypothetical protein